MYAKRSSSDNGFTLKNLKDTSPPENLWLWPGYIPLGSITLLTGMPGVGKTLALLSWAYIVASGGTWPDGSPSAQDRVLFIDGENGEAEVKRSRGSLGCTATERM